MAEEMWNLQKRVSWDDTPNVKVELEDGDDATDGLSFSQACDMTGDGTHAGSED